MLWAYLRRTDDYYRIRNVLITADFLGVIGYVLYPTAPPRMLTSYGFADTLNATRLNHHSGLISAFSPTRTRRCRACTPPTRCSIGTSGVLLTRRIWGKAIWALYPVLVVFSIVATANHFLLDAVAGARSSASPLAVVLATPLACATQTPLPARRRARRVTSTDAAGQHATASEPRTRRGRPLVGRKRPLVDRRRRRGARDMLQRDARDCALATTAAVKTGYTDGARHLASQSRHACCVGAASRPTS